MTCSKVAARATEKKKHNRGWHFYRLIRWFVKLFYPVIKVNGKENMPQEPSIYICNHCEMNGPIASQLYFPGKSYIWCASEMMDRKQVPAYAYKDFWEEKPKWTKWFYRVLSYVIAPLSECIFTNADCIPVYHDTRIISTFRMTMNALEEGANIVVFPEYKQEYNEILCDFQDGVFDIARLYKAKTGKNVAFVPMYLSPELGSFNIGEAVYYDPNNDRNREKHRLKNEMMERITDIALSLPRHKVVPYINTSRRRYLYSREKTEEEKKQILKRRPVVDYSGLRLSNIGSPEYSHLKLLLGWVGYFVLYFLTENLISYDKCHIIHSPLDDMIPFDERFLIFYVSWYVWIVLSLLYFLLYDIDKFKELQTFIIITQIGAMLVYIVYPSIQDLRPSVFPRQNVLTWLLGLIYRFDTPTGVCPSLHVAYSMGIMSCWLKYDDCSKKFKVGMVILAVMVSISTAFVKQHSVVDIFWAVPLSLLAEAIVYGKKYWVPRFRKGER